MMELNGMSNRFGGGNSMFGMQNGVANKVEIPNVGYGGSCMRKPTQIETVEDKLNKIRSTLTNKQKEAFDLAMQGESLLITGGGGVGKSYTLENIIFALRNIKKKNVIVCAPTGVAALNVGSGVTIHRQFGLPVEPCFKRDRQGILSPIVKANKALKACDCICIDECSMCRIDIFDSLYKSIEKANVERRKLGLKDIQQIWMGDFYQLNSVYTPEDEILLREYYDDKRHSLSGKLGGAYAFNSVNWVKLNLRNIVLDEVVRQKDEELIFHLNKIREGKHGYTNYFNHRVCMDEFEDAVTIYPYNIDVQRKNREKLAQLEGEEILITAELSGEATPDDCGDKYELYLKVGARVMFLINDNPKRANDPVLDREKAYSDKILFVNGTQGTLRAINLYENGGGVDHLVIETDDGIIVRLKKTTNQVCVYEEVNGKLQKKIIGSYSTFFVAPSYAISTHKSQGSTLDKVNIDPKAFTHGQLYVALSRVRSLEGLHLLDFIREDALIVDEEVEEFYKNLKEG